MIVFETAASAAPGGGGITITIAKPAGTVAGDVLVAGIRGALASGVLVITPPAGWVEVRQLDYSGSNSAGMFYKVMGASEPASYDFAYSESTSGRQGMIGRFSGVDNANPGAAVYSEATGTGVEIVAPSITTLADDAQLLKYSSTIANAAFTAPVGMSDVAFTARSHMSHGAQPVAGASGPKTTTLAASTTWYTVLWAMRPGAAIVNDPPTVALNTLDNASFGTQPVLEFTGTDPEAEAIVYQVEIGDTPYFTNGENIVDMNDQGGGANIHPNPSADLTWEGRYQIDDRPGQSFTSGGGILDRIEIPFGSDEPDTDGSVVARIYEHQGVFGETSAPLNAVPNTETPTPGWIALTDEYPFSTPYDPIIFRALHFSGANRIRLQPGQHYVYIPDWWSTTPLNSNTIVIHGDGSGTTHPGNTYLDNFHAFNWGVKPWDMHFKLWEISMAFSRSSDLNLGFANAVDPLDTSPFTSGEKVSYTVQDPMDEGTYYWRVRAKDPNGSNAWGDWTAVRTFTTDPTVAQTLQAFGVVSAEAFGTATVSTGPVELTAEGIPSAEAFGQASIEAGPVELQATGIESAEAFGTGQIAAGDVTLTATGIPSEEAFGIAQIETGALYLYGVGIPSEEAFGVADLSVGPVELQATGIESAEAFGVGSVEVASTILFGQGIHSEEAFGQATLTTGPVELQGTGIPSAEAFGTGTLLAEGIELQATGIPSAEAFGIGLIETGSVTLSGTGIPSAEAFGEGSIAADDVTLTAFGIESQEVFGVGSVDVGSMILYGQGIPSEEAFGTAVLSVSDVTLSGTGIPSEEAFGTGLVVTGLTLEATGIPSEEAFGVASLDVGPVELAGTGIPSAEAFGTGVLSVGEVTLAGTGIPSEESFGTAAIEVGAITLQAFGIESSEAFGVGLLEQGPGADQDLYATGIPSAEAFGASIIYQGALHIEHYLIDLEILMELYPDLSIAQELLVELEI